MHNINPTLIMGQVMIWLDKTGADIRAHEKNRIEIRVYDVAGAGYFFTGAMQAVRWYHKDGPDADHFCRADVDDLHSAIVAGGKVQICGSRGMSYGVWDTWDKFSDDNAPEGLMR